MESFRTFKDVHAAEDLARWLSDRGIQAAVADTSAYFDPSFANSILSKEWAVRIPAEQFSAARSLLQQFYQLRLSYVPKDYYLYTFSDSELDAILRRPDEWGDLDYALAQQILQDRGRTITEDELDRYRLERYEALSKPEEDDVGSLIGWGYMLAVAAGLVGALIGWHLMSGQKVLPDGKKVYRYSAPARKHGRRMLWVGMSISVAVALIWMYLRYQRDIAAFFP